jgi:endoglucanase
VKRHSAFTWRVQISAVALALAASFALASCASDSAPQPSPSASSGTPRPTVTATPTATASPVPTTTSAPTSSPTSPPADPAAAARAKVVTACQTWQASLSQDASTYPSTQAGALTIARSAAAGDAQWQPVVDTMQTLISLIGDNSSAGIAKGQQAFTDLGNECQAVGVVVNGG